MGHDFHFTIHKMNFSRVIEREKGEFCVCSFFQIESVNLLMCFLFSLCQPHSSRIVRWEIWWKDYDAIMIIRSILFVLFCCAARLSLPISSRIKQRQSKLMSMNCELGFYFKHCRSRSSRANSL